VQVTGIQPGAEVFLEGTGSGWWASLGPSDQTSAWLPLPVQLRDGEEVAIRQEVARRCELQPERKILKVGPQQGLAKPGLAQIDCNTTPTIYAVGLKSEADVEFAVDFEDSETTYRTAATETYGPLPAPPMPAGASVRVRQGECDVWSDWSDWQVAKAMAGPPLVPRISHDPFACQDALPVENIFPLNGYLRVMSNAHGEIARLPVGGNIMVIPVAPSFTSPDDVWVEHHVCGYDVHSDKRPVHPGRDVTPGAIKAPLFDGDSSVTVTGVIAGAHVELWEETKGVVLGQGRAPFGDSGVVNVVFSGFGALHAGWKLHMKTWQCGHYVQTPSVPVVFKAPVLGSIAPATAIAGSPGFLLTVKGGDLRPGASVLWDGAGKPTTFVSAAELHASIAPGDIAAPRSVQVRVVNPDGQTSGPMTFTVQPSSAKISLSVGIGAFNLAARQITSATFQVIAPGATTPQLVTATLDTYKKHATALYEHFGAAGLATYYVAVHEVEFTWRDVTDTADRTSTDSGPWTPTTNGSPVLASPGTVSLAAFAIDEPDTSPVRFELVRI
jgi:hypothetical protein